MNGHITRVADEIADILVREGIDYVQSKALFRAARERLVCTRRRKTRSAPAWLALGMHITDIQKSLGHEDIGATRIYAETSVAMLRRKFDQVTDRAGSDLLGEVRTRHGDVVGAFAAELLADDGHTFNTSADA